MVSVAALQYHVQMWFEEIFDHHGALRPSYAALARRTGRDPRRPDAAAAAALRDRPLDDDARIFPVPVVIDAAEYDTVLRAGLAQRARALQRLFADLVLGAQEVLGAGIGFTRSGLDGILAAGGLSLARLRELWHGHQAHEIRFTYGPDLVRDPTGRWLVLEDNVGCVGGTADSFFVAERYRAALGLPGCHDCDRRPDLALAVRRWLCRSGAGLPGAVLAVLGCDAGGGGPGSLRLAENARLREILEPMGIPVWEGGEFDRRWAAGQVEPPVTIVNFDGETAERSALGRAFTGGGQLLNAPGTGLLGNKAWLPYLDQLIRVLLAEEPILASPPTHLTGGGPLPPDLDNWVVKAVAGRQGREVFMLGQLPRQQRDQVVHLVRHEWPPGGAVAQRYVEPARLTPGGPGAVDSYQVEIRPVSYVLGWQEVYVGRQPAGRAISVYDPRRLGNLSQGACYVPVLREPCCNSTIADHCQLS